MGRICDVSEFCIATKEIYDIYNFMIGLKIKLFYLLSNINFEINVLLFQHRHQFSEQLEEMAGSITIRYDDCNHMLCGAVWRRPGSTELYIR